MTDPVQSILSFGSAMDCLRVFLSLRVGHSSGYLKKWPVCPRPLGMSSTGVSGPSRCIKMPPIEVGSNVRAFIGASRSTSLSVDLALKWSGPAQQHEVSPCFVIPVLPCLAPGLLNVVDNGCIRVKRVFGLRFRLVRAFHALTLRADS